LGIFIASHIILAKQIYHIFYSMNFYKNNFKLVFRALEHKNFRLFVSGQSLSLIGTWIQQVAVTWLVYRLTNSAFMLGIVGFSGQLPLFVIAPFAGVLADKANRHKLLLYTQTLALIQASVLSFLVFTESIQIWQLIVLSVILGIINAFDMPVRQAFVVEMIDNKKEDLGNAIAFNSSMVNAARLVGPSIAGILIATAGEGWCFLINAISFLAVVVSLLKMEVEPLRHKIKESKVFKELSEGFKYTFGFAPIRYLIILLSVVSLMSTSITLLAPVIAKEYLGGGADTFGFLMSAYGTGALVGAFYLLNKKNVLGLGKLIGFAVLLFGVSLIIFSFSRIFFLSLSIMAFAGMGMMLDVASTNTLLQTLSEENKRGRVMSFYSMAFRGMSPFGSLLAGGIGSAVGAPAAILMSGSVCVIGGGFYLTKLPVIRKLVRPIYQSMGILPQIAEGVEQATNPTVKPE
jgi:MFS family permease